MATGGRKTHLQVMHEISALFVVTPAFAGDPSLLSINGPLTGLLGVLPAGAVMATCRMQTATAFDFGTITMGLGTTPGGVQIIPAQNIKPLGAVNTIVGFATPALAAPLATDTPVYYSLATTGGPATAGALMVWLEYLPGVG